MTKQLGCQGEIFARNYLEKSGYRILAQNYRIRYGEIDLVAEDDGVLVFIEIKTRKSRVYGGPFDAVAEKKRVRISKVALEFMATHNMTGRSARFDVVAVYVHEDAPLSIEVIKNAFDLCYGL